MNTFFEKANQFRRGASNCSKMWNSRYTVQFFWGPGGPQPGIPEELNKLHVVGRLSWRLSPRLDALYQPRQSHSEGIQVIIPSTLPGPYHRHHRGRFLT
jgi:hypothetical protein